MLFAVQAYVEDYLHKHAVVDSDGYAVQVANLYSYHRSRMDTASFLRRVRRVRTVTFANSPVLDRAEFERTLIARLDREFKKKPGSHERMFPGGTAEEQAKLASLPRITIGNLLSDFGHAVEARAVDEFWQSRKNGRLKPKPERTAQNLLLMFTMGALRGRTYPFKELSSGIGYVDVAVAFTAVLHLVELKVLTSDFTGPDQLEQYMRNERRREGSLVVVDALPPGAKLSLPRTIVRPSGIIKVHRIDINPAPPSSLNQPLPLPPATPSPGAP